MRRAVSSGTRSEQGHLIVELAVIVPFLALFLLTVVDLGLVVREHQVLQLAVREGARFAALPENRISTSSSPSATEERIRQRVLECLQQENIAVEETDIRIDQEVRIDIGGTVVGASEISVTYNRPLLLLGAPLLPAGSLELSARSVFRNLF